MTDKQIIKALECKTHKKCEDCPYVNEICTHFELVRVEHILDLINRQKAENLSLQNKVELLEQAKKMLKEDSDKSRESAMEVIRKQEAEIERLTDEIRITREYIHRNNLEYDLLDFSLAKKRLRDELVKEMVGED